MTTGVDIVGTLLRDYADLVAVVPIERMKAGALPEGVAVPAILLRLVSSVERQQLVRGGTMPTTDRVAVTVRAASYREQRNIIRLVKLCCAGRTGNIGGGTRVAILHAGTGPDIQGPGDTFEQTQDFKVLHDA